MVKIQPWQLIYEERHFHSYIKNGLIVDSGVLLKFLKWCYLKDKEDANLSKEQKKMFDQLERFLSINCNKYITQHILAELSNLINVRRGNLGSFSDFINLIKTKLKDYCEISIEKERVLQGNIVNEFGIADAGMVLLSKESDKIILTYDEPFCNECKYKQNLPVIYLQDLDSLFLTLECLPK